MTNINKILLSFSRTVFVVNCQGNSFYLIAYYQPYHCLFYLPAFFTLAFFGQAGRFRFELR